MSAIQRESKGDILIVDDIAMDRNLLVRALSEAGYHTWVAESGQDALAVIGTALPDLVLLDVRMDGVDGYETCERIKANPRTCDVPIVFISALDDADAKVRGFAVGGADYITKPFQLQEVLARVETQLAVRRLQHQLQVANQELAARLDQLVARNAELDAFAHTVAHDLKNPLQVVLGITEIMLEDYGTQSSHMREMLGTVARVGFKMEEIINELLLLAELHRTDVKVYALDMHPIVQGAQERLSTMIQDFHATIVEPDTWPVALGHGPWMETVWANYISNAIKYGGRPPRVLLGAEAEGDGFIRYWVRDNGSGLTEVEQAKLFQPLQRLNAQQMEGQGLGLSIVRRIVERLGGSVAVRSQPGEGSEFSFCLPAA